MKSLIFVASIIAVRLVMGLVFIKTGIGQRTVTSQVVKGIARQLESKR